MIQVYNIHRRWTENGISMEEVVKVAASNEAEAVFTAEADGSVVVEVVDVESLEPTIGADLYATEGRDQ